MTAGFIRLAGSTSRGSGLEGLRPNSRFRVSGALVHLAAKDERPPGPRLLCSDPLAADGFRASRRQHAVQDLGADGRLCLLARKVAGT